MKIKDKTYYQKVQSRLYPPLKMIFDGGPVVIYGAGRLGIQFAQSLLKKKVHIDAFIDNNPLLNGKKILGISVINLDTAAKKYRLFPIVIASVLYGNEIYDLLIKRKFTSVYPTYYLATVSQLFDAPGFNGVFNSLFSQQNQKHIDEVCSLLADKESKKILTNIIKFRLRGTSTYLTQLKSPYSLFKEKSVCPLSPDEVFVDCGAYDGDTLQMFIAACKGKFNHIHAFEPDENNYKKLKVKASEYKGDIDVVKMGVYDKTETLHFSNNGTVDSCISETGTSVKVTSLDEYFKGKQAPTLVKMDIEGAEYKAIKGMKNIIKTHQPKLAISIYHTPSDLWRIIRLIKSYNRNYQFYIRHFTYEFADTMCFAL